MMKSILLMITVVLAFTGVAQKDLSHVDLDEFISETQLSIGGQDEISLAWLIPIEFWKLSFQGDSTMTDFQKKAIYETLEPYYIVAIADGTVGLFGSVDYSLEEDLRETLEITIDGSVHKPLKESYLSADMNIMLSSFKPVLSSMLGNMGENMHFFVFNDEDARGKRVLNLYDFGHNIDIAYLNKAATLKTPIGSLLVKKKCPVDNEEYNGGWKYCPYHGEELKKK